MALWLINTIFHIFILHCWFQWSNTEMIKLFEAKYLTLFSFFFEDFLKVLTVVALKSLLWLFHSPSEYNVTETRWGFFCFFLPWMKKRWLMMWFEMSARLHEFGIIWDSQPIECRCMAVCVRLEGRNTTRMQWKLANCSLNTCLCKQAESAVGYKSIF